MSDEEPDHQCNSHVRAADPSLTLWILQKEMKLLCCELRNDSRMGGWELRVFDDGKLCFTQLWALEGSARFFAAILKRDRLRHGWSALGRTTPWSGNAVFVNDLVFLARSNCPYVLDLMSNLNDALSVLHCRADYDFIDVDALPGTDARRGYPSPTVLWKGKDIFGVPAPTPPFQSY